MSKLAVQSPTANMSEMEHSVSAWLLNISDEETVAISQFEINHIEEYSEFIKIPKSPPWCNQVMLWKNQILPVLDFTKSRNSSLLNETTSDHSFMLAIVRIFNGNEQGCRYGAIRILHPPVLEKISNDQGRQKNDINSSWKDISLAAFSAGDVIVPVLNLNALFGGELKY